MSFDPLTTASRRYSVVGRSVTIASTCPFFSARTTSFELLNTRTCLEGAITAFTVSRLVVPTWTPICASFSSATVVAATSDESPATSTPWGVV
jgi:hypothetical protein